jgi:type VI secretion system secreted protein VgrG
VRLPLLRPGSPPTPAVDDEKRVAWNAVNAAKANMRASYYRPLSALRLSEDAIDQLAQGRLEREFLPGLRRLYDGFDSLPAPAQSALTDMAYNVGVAGLGKFTHLREAVNARDWLTASRECAVSTSREERNAWRAWQFKESAA